jgi:hypothetical protein
MELFELLGWLVAWGLYLMLQSIFINGIFISSYGTSERLPNGKDLDSEMIFYPIYKWLHRQYIMKVPFIKENITLSPNISLNFKIDFDDVTEKGFRVYSNDEGAGDWAIAAGYMQKYHNAKTYYDHTNRRILFYKEYEEYVVSKYLRKPTFGCIICMASFWSIFTFLIPVWYLYGMGFLQIILWFANIISLAYVNYLFFKKRV